MIFRRATLRLTVVFSAILLLLFGAFAIGVYLFVTGSFDYDATASTGSTAVDAAERSFADLRIGLVTGYVVLVFVVPVISYLMVKLVLEPARRGYEAQQRFVDDASHEFRTPLSIIQGELEFATSRQRSVDEYRAAMATALDEVEHLTAMTSDLLLLARGGATDLAAGFRPVELGGVLHRAARAHQSAAEGRIQVDVREPIEVLGSEDLLLRAIGNLIENAIKFAPGTAPIRISVERRGSLAHAEVTDFGRGLARSERRRAFDRFWRAERARSQPGHGLGLALVRQIMGAHHGTVRLEPARPFGTSAVLELPAQS